MSTLCICVCVYVCTNYLLALQRVKYYLANPVYRVTSLLEKILCPNTLELPLTMCLVLKCSWTCLFQCILCSSTHRMTASNVSSCVMLQCEVLGKLRLEVAHILEGKVRSNFKQLKKCFSSICVLPCEKLTAVRVQWCHAGDKLTALSVQWCTKFLFLCGEKKWRIKTLCLP